MNAFRVELTGLINKHSLENTSNTPDFILAQYLATCLMAFDEAVTRRADWHGHMDEPGGGGHIIDSEEAQS